MHATVIHADIHDLAEAKRGIEEDVIPMMKKAPGFKGACSIAMDGGHGLSVSVFETEEQARAAAPPEGAAAPGVTLGNLQFGEVIGAV